MRVQSDREKVMRDGSVGWVHKLDGAKPAMSPQREKQPEVTINAKKIMEEFAKDTRLSQIAGLSKHLGVSPRSLMDMGCVWSKPYGAFAWPMRDGYGNMVGIRLRAVDGRKWAVRGSHQGVFHGPRFFNGIKGN